MTVVIVAGLQTRLTMAILSTLTDCEELHE